MGRVTREDIIASFKEGICWKLAYGVSLNGIILFLCVYLVFSILCLHYPKVAVQNHGYSLWSVKMFAWFLFFPVIPLSSAIESSVKRPIYV